MVLLTKQEDIEQKPFFQLVSETTTNHFFLTEKTVKPLLLKQPFLVFGNVGFHKKLKDYGFKLYDEVFNYDFGFHRRCLIQGQK